MGACPQGIIKAAVAVMAANDAAIALAEFVGKSIEITNQGLVEISRRLVKIILDLFLTSRREIFLSKNIP